ncbi:MAG: ABC transporter ATP-binding protein/permease [Lachnospiraceae bacterium]|nr:ABC transporter ATP-binding protein/permease [Lachnospiraceae bacterium]
MIQLLKYLRQYKKEIIAAPILTMCETVSELILVMTIGRFIDQISNTDASMGVIYSYGLRLLGIAALCFIFGAAGGWISVKGSAGFSKNLRNSMFSRLQDFSFKNIDHFSTDSLVTRMTTDVANVQQAFMMILRVAVKSPISLVCALVMAFRINWKIGLIYVVVIPILGVGLFGIAKITHPIFQKVFKTYDKLNLIVRENLHGIRVVKGFVREDYETEKFKNVSGKLQEHFTKAEKILAFNSPMMQGAVYICMILISWIGAHAIVKSSNGTVALGISMTTGDLQNLLSYSAMILMALMMLSMIYVMVMMSRESARRISEVLNEEISQKEMKAPIKKIQNGAIEFENVGFSYNGNKEKLCLSDINIQIKSGETIGIIGGTGSEKSSLVQLIPRLYDATTGTVKVGGVDVRMYDMEALRNEVAFVLQKNLLFAGTIKENLRWGNADATDEEIEEVCRLAQADSFIREFPDGYDAHIEQGGTNVSGGQKQRLCIARALLKHPKILILDDSTSAVDTKTDALIRQAFTSYIPETTKIIIAQRITSVQDADRIIVMDGGRINVVGTHEELLRNNAIYREVYESQQKGGFADEAE